MNTAICVAIKNKRLITFRYDGAYRVVEPHTHGISTTREEALRGFQVGGSSVHSDPVGWKFFYLAKMRNLTLSDQEFMFVRPQFHWLDHAMVSIHCHV
jgi:hypothetical protein